MPSSKRPHRLPAKPQRHGALASTKPSVQGGIAVTELAAKKDRSVRQDVWSHRLPSPAATERFGEMIGRVLEGGEILALYGELGVGKTTLVRGIATGLHVPTRAVRSPTFSLIHEYAGRLPLAHADLYRLSGDTEVANLGLTEYLNGHTVVAVEWAEKAGGYLPEDRLELFLTYDRERSRRVLLRAMGTARTLLDRLKRADGRRRELERAR